MGAFVSPGVYATEIDFSLYIPALSTTIVGMVGTASWGPKDTLTLITDEGNLVATFGRPSAEHLAMYAAIRYLRRGRQLWFVRVATYDARADVTAQADDGVTDSLEIEALWTGSFGNRLGVDIEDGFETGTYKLVVKDNNVPVETFNNLKVGAANVNDDDYIETRINGISDFITVTDIDTESTLELTSVTLTGGLDGAPADDAEVIGTTVGNTRTGLQLFRDQDNLDVNIIAAPGRWERTIATELISICDPLGGGRGDCMALIDPPIGLTVQQVVDYHNGNLTGNPAYPTASLNSSYAAMHWPWVQVYDAFTDAEIMIPPSGHIAGVMAFTDFEREPWFAPAGLQRGRLVDVLDIEYSPNQGDRDFMYSGGNRVNPIVNFTKDGITVWGQRTLQVLPTALDRINVRRMLLFLKKAISTASRFVVFEPNDPVTWRLLKNLIEPFLRSVQARRGIIDFRVVVDETTNTPDRIDRNELLCRIFIKPVKAAEIIELEFILLPTGADFEEFINPESVGGDAGFGTGVTF